MRVPPMLSLSLHLRQGPELQPKALHVYCTNRLIGVVTLPSWTMQLIKGVRYDEAAHYSLYSSKFKSMDSATA